MAYHSDSEDSVISHSDHDMDMNTANQAPPRALNRHVNPITHIAPPEAAGLKTLGRFTAKYLEEPDEYIYQKATDVLGRQTTLDILHQTTKLHNQGGMVKADGSPRTIGGSFLYLIKTAPPTLVCPAMKDAIFDRSKEMARHRKLYKPMQHTQRQHHKNRPSQPYTHPSHPHRDTHAPSPSTSHHEPTLQQAFSQLHLNRHLGKHFTWEEKELWEAHMEGIKGFPLYNGPETLAFKLRNLRKPLLPYPPRHPHARPCHPQTSKPPCKMAMALFEAPVVDPTAPMTPQPPTTTTTAHL